MSMWDIPPQSVEVWFPKVLSGPPPTVNNEISRTQNKKKNYGHIMQ